MNANAKRGSGGVAIAVSRYIMRGHSVQGAYMTNTDGLLGIKIIDNKTCFKLGIIANYLPPDSYHYGQDSEGYFNDFLGL